MKTALKTLLILIPVILITGILLADRSQHVMRGMLYAIGVTVVFYYVAIVIVLYEIISRPDMPFGRKLLWVLMVLHVFYLGLVFYYFKGRKTESSQSG